MSRRDGIADNPLQGAEIGALNKINRPVIEDRIDRRKVDFLSSAKYAAREQYTANVLSNRGTWKGVVLRVELPSIPPTGPVANYSELRGLPAPVRVHIKCIIPELHCMIPDPEQLGSSHGPSQQIIDLYPTFIAMDDTIPVPAIGSIINLDFEDKQNFEGPIFLGAVGQQSVNLGAEGLESAAAYAAARCGAPLGATGPSGAPLGTSAGSFPVGNLPRLRSGAGPWYTRENSLEGATTIVIHSTAGRHYPDGPAAVQRWISHGLGRRVGTNFVILEDGTIVLLAPPERYAPWHAGHMNRISVGIDLTGHPGRESYPHTQRQFTAVRELIGSNELKNLAVIGHRHYKRNRSDPGHQFDDEPNNLNFNFAHEDIRFRTLPEISGVERSAEGSWNAILNAERAEHDIRGKVGPGKELGHQPLINIHERLKSNPRSGRGSYRELDNFYDGSEEYLGSFT